MRIIKHSSQVFPSIATGSLVGLDVEGQLQVTNSFNMPQVDGGASVGDANDAQLAAQIAAPRAKANIAYQTEMIRMLREVSVDAQSVGWPCRHREPVLLPEGAKRAHRYPGPRRQP
jgi:translation initiation factor 3 subunit H